MTSTTDTAAGAASGRRRWLLVALVVAVTIAAVSWWVTVRAEDIGLTGDTCFGMVDDETIVEVLQVPADELRWELTEWGSQVGGWCAVYGGGHRLSVEVSDVPDDVLDDDRENDITTPVLLDGYPDWDVLVHDRADQPGTFMSAYLRADGEIPTDASWAAVYADLPDDSDEQAAVIRVLEELLDYYETWLPPDQRYDAAA